MAGNVGYPSSYTNFLNGVTIRGTPILQLFPGKVFWVNNSSIPAPGGLTGNDGNSGDYLHPVATIAQAVNNLCKASRGDIVVCMPGHAETVSSSTSMTLSTAGVAIVGLGLGTLRPSITYTTATTATVNVTASNIAITNVQLIANFAAVAAAFTLTTAKWLTLSGCEIIDTSSILNFVNIVATDATANHADGLTIDSCTITGLGTTASTATVLPGAAINRLSITNNFIQNKCASATGALVLGSTFNLTMLRVASNDLNFTGTTSGAVVISTTGTNTGIVCDNYIHGAFASSPVIVTAGHGTIFMNNLYEHSADASGYLIPPTDSG